MPMSLRRFAVLLLELLTLTTFVSAQDRAAKKRVAPAYPELARRMHVGGAVKLQLDVDPEGQVKEVKIVEGHALLRDAAVTAARQWVFAKAPSKTVELVEVNFKP